MIDCWLRGGGGELVVIVTVCNAEMDPAHGSNI